MAKALLKKKKKLPPLSKLKRLADHYFSVYVRTREIDAQGNATCFTCGVKKPWKEQQNSHFYSRTFLSLRWDEVNCQVGCYACNIHLKGNLAAFAVNLTRKYGTDILEKLAQRRVEIRQMNRLEYNKLIEKYKL